MLTLRHTYLHSSHIALQYFMTHSLHLHTSAHEVSDKNLTTKRGDPSQSIHQISMGCHSYDISDTIIASPVLPHPGTSPNLKKVRYSYL